VLTTEAECFEALREAAERLEESPTKADYEDLGLRPASATIIRVVGGGNEAKEKADLDTNPSTGTRVQPKTDHVAIPEDSEWDELSVDQRWHYRNVERNTERTLSRRQRLCTWANDHKRDRGCHSCSETRPACLDFHHDQRDQKSMAVTDMITNGYGRETLRAEIAKCTVLCANCHRREHYETPDTDREGVRAWLYERKATAGCSRCDEDDPRCLVFHHASDEKRATIAQMVSNGRSEDAIETELDRCVVLCSNCHRIEHHSPPSPPDGTDNV
jgi:hypothetical protein